MTDGPATGTGAAIFGCAGLSLTRDEAAFFRDADPFGFIVFARNVDTPDQVLRLTASLRDAVGRDAPVMIDQEGGRVQRLRAPHWREWTAPLDAALRASSLAEAAEVMALRARLTAIELRACGIDTNCAPVADIADDATHPVLRNRCFGTDAAAVTLVARAVAEALLSGGVLPVIKHIPGHGRARADSHLALPVVTEPRELLETTDFAPFRALADLPMAMTAHIRFAAIDPDLPTTLSPAVIDAIRHDIGFAGLLMTDDISMQALAGTVAERAGLARAAGCDVVLHCNGEMVEMQAVAAAAGAMDAQGTARGALALARRCAVQPVDAGAMLARLVALGQGPLHGG